MKKLFILLTFIFSIPVLSWAQAPQAVSYQAIARTSSGTVMANTNVSVRISVKNNSANGATVYQETHTGITTNQFGLFTLEIGNGTPVSGTFPAIDWANGNKFIKVELDPAGGTAYADMGTAQLLSVPYALYAGQSAGGGTDAQTLSLSSGGILSISNGNNVTLPLAPNYTAGTGVNITGSTISNTGDLSSTNELQTLSIAGTSLTISNGNTVTLPAGGSADNWGTDVVHTDATVTGNGTTVSPVKIAQQSATNGQVLKWNGTTWAPAADNGSGGNYTAGTGISIVGTVITNTGDNDNSVSNEIQSLSLAGTTLSLSSGGGSVTLPAGGGGVSGSGTNNYVAKFTPNGTTLGNSLIQDNGTYIGLNAAPNTTDRLYLNAGATQTGGLKINYTNTASGSYGLNTTGTNGNSYLNYTGNVTFGTLTAVNPIIYGSSAAGTSPGLLGATSGTNTSAAVVGLSNNWHGGFFASNDLQGGVGLFGYYVGAAESYGVVGEYAGSKGGAGIFGQNINTSTAAGFGVLGGYYGTADTSVGVVGYNARTTALSLMNFGVEGAYNGAGYGAGVVGIGLGGDIPTAAVDYGVWGSAGGTAGSLGTYAVYADGNLTCTGLKNASVGTSKGNQLVYSIESPEVWFEDFGHGTLVNGQTTINLDELFLETVQIDAAHEMIVTVTPEGNCKGLYVEPGTTSFNVKELNAGTSNVNFTYRITCKRKDYQDHRFGSDLTWGGGDTRINYHYVAPIPIDYATTLNACILFKKQNQNNVKTNYHFLKNSNNLNSITKKK